MNASCPPAPVVTVVIPVYNVRAYLSATLDSLVNQTFREWECLCIDDGSTDDSADIIRKYTAWDSRFRLISQQNQGLAAARNQGMKEMRGEFLALVDADDLLHPDMLSCCVERMREDGSDICVFEVDSFDSETQEPRDFYIPVPVTPEEGHVCFAPAERQGELFLSIAGCAWNKLYRVDFLRKHGLLFPRHLKRSEDTPFSAWCLALAGRISCLRRVLYHYRQNREDSLMRTLDGLSVRFCYIDAAKEIWRGLKEHGCLKTFGMDALLLSAGNALYYLSHMKGGLTLYIGTCRLRRFVYLRLLELQALGVSPTPEIQERLYDMTELFVSRAHKQCDSPLLIKLGLIPWKTETSRKD